MSLCLHPLTIKEANALVLRWHRHSRPVVGALWAVGVAAVDAVGPADEPCGCAIVGRPIARLFDTGWTAEVLRLVTDGTPNACSMLYGACWRAARALGYQRLITYTLNTEPGTSLKAAGWRMVGQTRPGSWSRADRPRVDLHPLQAKLLWEAVP